MSVDVETYKKNVKILMVPIPGTEIRHPKGGFAEGTLFWLHTFGMGQYDRPEIEMYNVPALFLADAAQHINHWAYYSIDNEIKAGENIQSGNSPLRPLFTMDESPNEHDYWGEVPCLRIVLEAVLFQCARCGECEGHGDDKMVH